jgi:2-keto-3-deoxy-L-rhamnonate aldolase RhmA
MTAELKAKLRSNTLTIGSWISLGHPAIAEILSRAGFDWLVIDMEHSTISIREAGELIRVIDLCGVAPLVRVTSNDADLIKRVMDAGAHGVVVPMVNSAADAVRAVASTRYPPAGTRGVGMARAQRFGPSGFQDYLKWQQDGPIVIAQIEHVSAIEAADDILAVPGIDGFIVGPYDLSASLGIPGEFTHAKYTSALTRVLEAGRKAGKPAGLHLVEPDPGRLETLIADGFRVIAYSVDFRMIDATARAGLVTARGGAR